MAMDAMELGRVVDAEGARLVLWARQWCAGAGLAAEDLVQEAFLKLVRQRKRPDDVRAWLFRVVRNAALDAAKVARRRQRREIAVAGGASWFVEPQVDGLDAQTAVAALEGLADEQREVIVARCWGGLSFEQIAAVVGTSASTAFRRYEAGVEALRKQLGVQCLNRSSID